MEDLVTNIAETFEDILENLVDGETYDRLPPRGPQDLDIPSISNDALESLDQDIWGQDEEEDFSSSQADKRTRPVEIFAKKTVPIPTEEELNGLNVMGIVGDNKRVLTTSFHLILARAAIVNFRYTAGYEKPYFYTRNRAASSLLVLDENIFSETYSIHTYNDLYSQPESPLLDHFSKNVGNKPFRFKFDYERRKKAPSSQSLGLAVKFQHTLELFCIDGIDFPSDGITICLKEGPIFSNSTAISDIKNGLQKLLAWKNKKRFYVGISTKVSESRVLIKTLSEHPHLIEQYFPDQNITIGQIESFGTDSLLLRKILKPGERTRLVEYIEETRESAISDSSLRGLKPLTCYYHKRSKPYGFVRLEIPRFFWDADADLTEFALSVAAWQYELGGNTPLVLKAAAERSELSHERWIIDQQMKAAFEKRNLGLIEFLETE